MVLMLTAMGVSLLSSTLTYGWEHVVSWVNTKVLTSLILACGLAYFVAMLSTRVNQWALLLTLLLHIFLVNLFDQDVYLAQTLQTWEQGRYVRFNGLAQWVGWLWPYAVACLMLAHLIKSSPEKKPIED